MPPRQLLSRHAVRSADTFYATNARLQAATTPEAVLCELPGALNGVNIATALRRLARMHHVDGGRGVPAFCADERFSNLEELLLGNSRASFRSYNLESDDSQLLVGRARAMAAWAAARLGRAAVFSSLLRSAAADVNLLRPPPLGETSLLLWASAELRASSRAHASTASTRSPRVRLVHADAAALSVLADAAAARLESFRPNDLAIAVLRSLTPSPAAVAQQTGNAHPFEPVGSRDAAHRLPASLSAGAAAAELRELGAVTPGSLSRLLSSYGGNRSAGNPIPPPRLVAAVGVAALQVLPAFSAPSLAHFLWSHATSGATPHPAFAAAAPAAMAAALRAPGASAHLPGGRDPSDDLTHAAALGLWAFDRLRIHPGGAFLAASDGVLRAESVALLSLPRLVGIASAAASMQWRPSAWFSIGRCIAAAAADTYSDTRRWVSPTVRKVAARAAGRLRAQHARPADAAVIAACLAASGGDAASDEEGEGAEEEEAAAQQGDVLASSHVPRKAVMWLPLRSAAAVA